VTDGAQAMQAGREAFDDGKSLDDCPYTRLDLVAAWRTGMTQAARDAIAKSIEMVTALRRMPKH
jgi:ribosome modulation factor